MATTPKTASGDPPEKPDAESDPGTGMETGDMKLMLAKSKRAPINCAVGTSKDAKSGLLLMHPTKKPKALLQDLKKAVPGMKNPRWGTATVDMEANPKLVSFALNKALSNLDRKLIKTLKGTGFSKVAIAE